MSDAMFALLLTTLAGLSTGIGALLAFVIKKPRKFFLPFTLGFSGGVMLYISFVEMLPTALVSVGEASAVFAFFVGMGFIALIDMLIPQQENPHNFIDRHKYRKGKGKGDCKGDCDEKERDKPKKAGEDDMWCSPTLMRTGMFTALAIGIHNFPEGMATFATTLSDPSLGIVIAIAIALHNIPEGLSVSVPIYCATGSKKTAFKYSFISGIAEPVGALIAFAILMPFMSDALLGMLLASVAGIMVYISIDEIIPTAHSYGKSHVVIGGVVLGMMVMAVSLLMLVI